MHDRELCLEILRQREEAAIKIGSRFQVIHQASDLTDSPTEVEKLDSICMRSERMSEKIMDSGQEPKKRDPDLAAAEIAMKRAAAKARLRAKQVGAGVMVLKDGGIVEERQKHLDR